MLYAEFLAIKAIYDECQRGSDNKVYKAITHEQRLAIGCRFNTLLQTIVTRAELDAAPDIEKYRKSLVAGRPLDAFDLLERRKNKD